MGLNIFKKKDDDDDFSDFTKESSSDHMGLPLTGDITDTGSNSRSSDSGSALFQQPSIPDSPSSAPLDSPGSFNQLNSEKQKQIAPESSSSDRIISLEKDVQLLNAKMDAVRAVLENINHKLTKIEKLAEDSKSKEEETIRW